MSTYCATCGKELPSDWKFPRCPYCGNELPKLPDNNVGGSNSFTLGDANAIAGDVTIDSHNTVTNIVNERQKHREEIHQEKVQQFKKLCEAVYADGVMTSDEARQLENLRLELGIDSAEADQIRESVRQLRLTQAKNQLNPVIRISLQQIVGMAMNGKYELLKQSFPRLEAMAEKYNVEEVQFYYYLLLSGIEPRKCIKLFESRQNDNYWQSFWTYIAYQNIEELDKAQLIMADLENWTDHPYGNVALLATVGSLYTYWEDMTQTEFLDQARMLLEQGADVFSDSLDRFAQSLILLTDDNDDNLHHFQGEFRFYFDYVFSGLMHKRKMAHVYSLIQRMPKIAPLPKI